MKLKEICHSRTGDKGDISNISLIPWNEADYPMLKEQVTAQRVKEYFSEICLGKVTRYEADGICALNFGMNRRAMDKTSDSAGITRPNKYTNLSEVIISL